MTAISLSRQLYPDGGINSGEPGRVWNTVSMMRFKCLAAWRDRGDMCCCCITYWELYRLFIEERRWLFTRRQRWCSLRKCGNRLLLVKSFIPLGVTMAATYQRWSSRIFRQHCSAGILLLQQRCSCLQYSWCFFTQSLVTDYMPRVFFSLIYSQVCIYFSEEDITNSETCI